MIIEIIKFIYKIFIVILGLFMNLFSLFNSKANLWIKGRSKENLVFFNRDFNKKLFWIHASSLGEFEQGLPLLKALQEKYNNYQFAISFFSPSGFQIIKPKNLADFTFYIPLDTKKNAEKLIKNLKPNALFLIKYDYWYILLSELQKKNIPIYVVSAKIRDSFKPIKFKIPFLYDVHKNIKFYFSQDKNTNDFLIKNNIKNTLITGDTRFDRVKQLINQPEKLDFIKSFKHNKLLFVAGSTWQKDDDLLIRTYNKLNPNKIKLCLVPHEINKKYLLNLKSKFNNSLLYSELEGKKIEDYDVLIIDSVGILTKIYSYADFAFVGGAFNKNGVHNVLEPAVFRIPVFFGPNIKKFDEAKELVQNKGGFIIKNEFELTSFIIELINNPIKKELFGNNAKNTIFSKENSVEKIISNI